MTSQPRPDSNGIDLSTALTPAWRKPLLLSAGTILLCTGVALQAGRIPLLGPAPAYANAQGLFDESSAAPAFEVRFSGPLRIPTIATGDDANAEAGGVGERHAGEEGKMGKPTSKAKTGLYGMRGPKDAIPQMSRNFDPGASARSLGTLGIIGSMQQQSGHFLASPYGAALAVGNDDEDVWGGLTGTEVGTAYGVGGLGLVGTGRGGGGVGEGAIGLEVRGQVDINPVVSTSSDRFSTFSVDVDTASYALVRRSLAQERRLPEAHEVRTEELVNYFDYAYPQPQGDVPFSVTTELGPCPWNPERRLVHVGVQGKSMSQGGVPPRNFVFLVDVSGSMSANDKLGLVRGGLLALVDQLGPQDRIAMVVYAGASGVVLPPTAGDDKAAIRRAIQGLESAGSTNGAAGIELAYEAARSAFIPGGVNRVILATDGDFNVGVTDHDALVRLIEDRRRTGVFLSVLGVGANSADSMMEQLADHGNGNYAHLDNLAEARRVLVRRMNATTVAIAKDVKVQVEFDPDKVVSHRLVGYENRVLAHKDFDDDTKDAGEIGAGHSVTALYEIEPKHESLDEGFMDLRLRYKEPDGRDSQRIDAAVPTRRAGALDGTSENFRFSAAVAAYGELLRGASGMAAIGFASVRDLAAGARTHDPHCDRAGFIAMVDQTRRLRGKTVRDEPIQCVPGAVPTLRAEPQVEPEQSPASVDSQPEPQDGATTQPDETRAFLLEVLRLLPPLLALPLFVMAFRGPRRRRR